MRTITNIGFSAIAVLLLFACSNQKFKKHQSGLKYRFIEQHATAQLPIVSDIIAINFRYTNSKGELIEASDFFRTQLQKPSHAGGSIEDALAMMHKGDSAIFKINAENYYTQTRHVRVPKDINPTDDLYFYIKMIDIISYEEFEEERHVARLSDQREEDKLLSAYLKRTNVTQEPTMSGMYYIEQTTGKGAKAEPGKLVTVHYLGYLIDGQLFDSSYDSRKPFTFTLGVGDVIPGWDEGISKMREGGKAKLIIPSSLAYGDQQIGSIPPFATLVFDVELLKVQ